VTPLPEDVAERERKRHSPGYSHLAGPVSALIMAGAPAAPALIPLIRSLQRPADGVCAHAPRRFRERGVTLSFIAPIALAVTAIVGAFTLVYPIDPLGLPVTESGGLHLWFAGIATGATMLAVLSTAVSLGATPAGAASPSIHTRRWRQSSFPGCGRQTRRARCRRDGPLPSADDRCVLQWLFVVALALLARRAYFVVKVISTRRLSCRFEWVVRASGLVLAAAGRVAP